MFDNRGRRKVIEELEKIRKEIEKNDALIVKAFEERMMLCEKVAEIKKKNGLQIRDENREKELIRKNASRSENGFEDEISKLYESIFEISRQYQHKLNKDKNIVLTGMPGCGKSSTGKLLAKKLGYEFFDTDDEIEREIGKSPESIILEDGEETFRNHERKVVERISENCGCVIATGGGCVLCGENVKNLKKHGIIFFITCPTEKLSSEKRPLSQGENTLEKMYETRRPIYEKTADHTVSRGDDTESTCDLIIAKLNEEKDL